LLNGGAEAERYANYLAVSRVEPEFFDNVGIEARLAHFEAIETGIEAVRDIGGPVAFSCDSLSAAKLVTYRNLGVRNCGSTGISDYNSETACFLARQIQRSKNQK
jgi:hypothetical protein